MAFVPLTSIWHQHHRHKHDRRCECHVTDGKRDEHARWRACGAVSAHANKTGNSKAAGARGGKRVRQQDRQLACGVMCVRHSGRVCAGANRPGGRRAQARTGWAAGVRAHEQTKGQVCGATSVQGCGVSVRARQQAEWRACASVNGPGGGRAGRQARGAAGVRGGKRAELRAGVRGGERAELWAGVRACEWAGRRACGVMRARCHGRVHTRQQVSRRRKWACAGRAAGMRGGGRTAWRAGVHTRKRAKRGVCVRVRGLGSGVRGGDCAVPRACMRACANGPGSAVCRDGNGGALQGTASGRGRGRVSGQAGMAAGRANGEVMQSGPT
jgi:hypothetical protein